MIKRSFNSLRQNSFTFITLAVFCLPILLMSCQKDQKSDQDLTQWVNPLLGTEPLTDTTLIGYTPPKGWRVWAGLTYPGATLPNAMVQLSPITKFHTGAGYQYEDSVIKAFTHTDKGHWNLCHIPILPVTGEVTTQNIGSHFSHDSESASPGYYQVLLKDYGINVELTTTLRAGFHRYEFPDGLEKKVAFNLARSNEHVRGWQIEQVDDSTVAGYQDTGYKVYFYGHFNRPVDHFKAGAAQDSLSIVSFSAQDKNPIELKIGLSFVSRENAKENVQTEIGDRSFADVKEAAHQKWNNLLHHVEVEGGTDRQKKLFYSSLYRAFQWPALRSDVNGEFRDAKGKVDKGDFRYYTRPSLWDTYRNKLVLLAMFSPDVTADVIQSLVDRGEKTGFIPTFFHGDHAASFISGSYLRGIDDFDVQKAYHLLIHNATVEGGTRPYIKEYMKKGYISTPRIANPNVETKAKAAVTKTLEYAYDDYAIANLAKQLGDSANYDRFIKRSGNYKNVFDKSTGFMRGRLKDGQWVSHFNPQYPYYEYMYREANAWQSTFFAPQDVDGLISLYGSKARFESKLDSLFSIPWNPHYIARNVCCFIGQYAQGNQPDHNYPYLYYFVGKQARTQQILNRIMSRFYGAGRHGLALSGMDDAGEMSAWYVFNAMGFYPFSPADGDYLVSVPLFDKVQVRVNDHTFNILKEGNKNEIDRFSLDGKTVNDGFKLTYKQLQNRVTLRIYNQ